MIRFSIALMNLLGLLVAPMLYGQVAIAPLDPSQPVRMPQATALRYVTGDNQSDDKRTASISVISQQGQGEFADQTISWNSQANGFVLLAKTEGVNIEVFSQQDQVAAKYTGSYGCVLEFDRNTCGSSGTNTSNRSQMQVNFSLQKGRTTYGGLYRTKEVNGGKEEAFGGGVLFQLQSIFFLSAGLEQVSPVWGSSYQNTLYGAGLLAGKSTETQFRLEYSVQEGSGGNLTQTAAEVKMGRLVLSFVNEVLGSGYWDSRDSNIFGLGLIPQNGMILSARAQMDQYNKNSASSKHSGTKISGTLGYNF